MNSVGNISMKMSSCSAVLVAFFLAAGANADWVQWRGPNQDGVSNSKNLPKTWTPEGENLLWSTPMGGMSSPVIMNNRLYILSRVGEQEVPGTLIAGPKTQEAMVCVDATTGKVLWTHTERMRQTEAPFHRAGWGSPVADPTTGYVYFFGTECKLLCLDGETGKIIWSHQMTERYGHISSFGGRTTTPAIDGDNLIIHGVAFGFGDHNRVAHRVFSFDKKTGELVWTNTSKWRPTDTVMSTPMVAKIGDQRMVIITGGDGAVTAFQSGTGKRQWAFDLSKRGLNSSPLIDEKNGRLFFQHSEENLDTEVMGAVVALDIKGKEPKEIWRKTGIEAGFTTPTLLNDRLYVVTSGGKLLALNANTGERFWRKSMGTIGRPSVLAADGKLYVAEGNGRMYVFEDEGRRAKRHSKVEWLEKRGREYVNFGSYAASDGRVFINTANRIFCLAKPGWKPSGKKYQTPWNMLPPKTENVGEPAQLLVYPAHAMLKPGDKTHFKAIAYDGLGQKIGEVDAEWSVEKMIVQPRGGKGEARTIGNLAGEIDDKGAYTAGGKTVQGGRIVAKFKGMEASSRIRVFPKTPWQKKDFTNDTLDKDPFTWVGAGGKFHVEKRGDDGNVLVKQIGFDLYARARTYFGPDDLSNYTLVSDIKTFRKQVGGEMHQPDVGVINSGYALVLQGSVQQLQINYWPPTLPYSLNKTIPYKFDADTWYTMKLRVEQHEDKALVLGKVWKRGEKEPAEWTIQLEDKAPMRFGAPGLFGDSLVTPIKSEVYYDNIEVLANE